MPFAARSSMWTWLPCTSEAAPLSGVKHRPSLYDTVRSNLSNVPLANTPVRTWFPAYLRTSDGVLLRTHLSGWTFLASKYACAIGRWDPRSLSRVTSHKPCPTRPRCTPTLQSPPSPMLSSRLPHPSPHTFLCPSFAFYVHSLNFRDLPICCRLECHPQSVHVPIWVSGPM